MSGHCCRIRGVHVETDSLGRLEVRLNEVVDEELLDCPLIDHDLLVAMVRIDIGWCEFKSVERALPASALPRSR